MNTSDLIEPAMWVLGTEFWSLSSGIIVQKDGDSRMGCSGLSEDGACGQPMYTYFHAQHRMSVVQFKDK